MKKYYDILGISQNSSENEIKRAYRISAKTLHPDVNTSPDAHEKFIELNEAYICLLHQKENKNNFNKYASYYKQAASMRKSREEIYKEWQRRRRAQARAQAAKHAKMKYEAFINSKLYKSALVLYKLVDILYVFMGFMIVFVPFLTVILNGIEEEKIAITIIALLFTTIFGTSMVIMILKPDLLKKIKH